jgi:predicted ATP-grasp superfamily ATP-dependent carboligase
MAVVLGDIELVRPLAMNGIRCAVVASSSNTARFSRRATTILSRNGGSSRKGNAALDHDEELASRLLEYGLSQPELPVLFYQWNNQLLFVSRHRERLAQAFRFVIADAEKVEDLADKVRFQAMAQALSLPVPAARVLRPARGSSPPDLSDLGFPLIVKPHHRSDGLWRAIEPSRKALRIGTPEALGALWLRLPGTGTFVAQQYVGGPESSIESYHVYVADDGEIVGEFTGHKLRTSPADCGHTTALTVTRIEDVARCGRELVRVLGLRGVAKLDFKRAPDGSLYLLEVNPRFNLWHHPGARAGVNLPALVFADLTGRPRPPAAQRPAEVRWCSPRDLKAARESGMSIAQWLPWALSCETKALWAWDDPMPLVGTGASRLLHGARRIAAHGRR